MKEGVSCLGPVQGSGCIKLISCVLPYIEGDGHSLRTRFSQSVRLDLEVVPRACVDQLPFC